jgi:hypothetical protein
MRAANVNWRSKVEAILKLDRRIDEIKINQGRILSQLQRGLRHEKLWQYGFKVFSQWDEDGIIQHLVAHLDIKNRTFIEFGVEDFRESNCRFLMMKDRWAGFVLDGSPENIARLQASYYYWQYLLSTKAEFITKENVSQLLEESSFDKDVGVLSIDIDGVDFHVLERLGQWRPSILVVEYNEALSSTRPVSVPYDPQFVRARKHFSNQYWGANLAAFCYLADRRGYGLVGTNAVMSNAFFVRRDLLNDVIKEVSMASCQAVASYRDSRDESGALTYLSGRARCEVMREMPLIDVSSGEQLRVADLHD